MPDLNVTLVLPSGGARAAEVPDDVIVRDLLSEFTSLLQMPTVGPDGRPMTYRLALDPDVAAVRLDLIDHATVGFVQQLRELLGAARSAWG